MGPGERGGKQEIEKEQGKRQRNGKQKKKKSETAQARKLEDARGKKKNGTSEERLACLSKEQQGWNSLSANHGEIAHSPGQG